MGLETATYIVSLVVTNPDGSDARSTADDHLRLLKAVLKRTFPLLDGAVSLSHTQLMYANDLSASVQYQFNTLRDGPQTANFAVSSRYANSASFATVTNYANSASYAAQAGYAQSASYATNAGTALYANSASYAVLAGTATLALTANSASYAVSAGSSALLGGLAGAAAATASTVALRDSSGYLFSTYFNQSSSDSENPTIASFFVGNGSDGYLRKATLAYVNTFLTTRNITGKTGIAKTLSSSAPSGGADGDLWYRY